MLSWIKLKRSIKITSISPRDYSVRTVYFILSCLLIIMVFSTAGFLGSTSLLGRQSRIDPNEIRTQNPHWQAQGCSSCHQIEQEKVLPLAERDIDGICLNCHDGKHAPAELHPIARELPQTNQFTHPPDWPLIDGKLSCWTCHDVKMACNRSLRRPLANPIFLRARLTGNKQKFCQNCHLPTSFSKFIPHIMISGSNEIINLSPTNETNIDEHICRYCHLETPDRTTLKRSGNARLRSPEMSLCQACHPTHSSFSSHDHLNLKITPKMLVYMYIREQLGPTAKINSQYLERLSKSNVKPTRMTPNAQGNIACTTCHNPHQENVFPDESDLAFEPMWLIGPSRIKSPTSGNQICPYCHG